MQWLGGRQAGLFRREGTEVSRRTLCRYAGALTLSSFAFALRGHAVAGSDPSTLLSVPLELSGDWGGSPTAAALIVVKRMREVCLAGVKLVSDQQPDTIRVDDHSSGSPAIWLHDDHTRTAWIIVDIGSRDWCKLSYQFGHELGHVLCNSWAASAKPQPPSQWIEESLVEAFSIRGLGRLASSWEKTPPFPGDNAFAAAIRQYRQNVIDGYAGAVDRKTYTDLADWFHNARINLERRGMGLNPLEGPAILAIQAELEKDDACVADMGALNRWPERTAVPVEKYLALWEASCAELLAPGQLPDRLRNILGIPRNHT